MKFSFPSVLFLILGLIAPLLLPATDYYIMYDESCMDRLEYGYGFTPQDQNYVKYHIKINPTEVLVLEVGTETNAPTQNYLSSSTVSCGNDLLSQSLINKVRGREDQVFMVQPQGNRYKISKVNMGSYWRRDDRGLVYNSWQFSFNYLGSLEPGRVLTNDPSKGIKVTYQGMTPYKCTDAFLFRMTFLHGSSSYRDIFLIPGLGIAEERPNSGSPDDIYRLREVDGVPFDTYLQQQICNSGMATANNYMPGTSSSPRNNRGTLTARGISTAQPTGPTYHEVEKGETLYSISRKYDVSVAQLREWNELGNSSMLRIGDRLQVSSNRTATPPPVANALPLPDQGSFAFDSGSSKPTAATTPPTTMQARGARDSRFAWETTDGTHQVQRGETVALLALKYGYTEARFRQMNDLGPSDIVKVGQVLKTTDCPPSSQPVGGSYMPPSTTATPAAPPRSDFPTTSNYTLPSPYDSQPSSSRSTADPFTPKAGTATLPSSSFEPYASSGPDFSVPRAEQDRNTPQSYDSQVYYARGGSGVMRNYEERRATETARQPSAPRQSSYSFGTPLPGSSGTAVGENPYSPYDQPERYRSIPQSYDTRTQSSSGTTPQQRVYVVKEGDTIESIARQFNKTPEQLRKRNNLAEREILIPYTRLYID